MFSPFTAVILLIEVVGYTSSGPEGRDGCIVYDGAGFRAEELKLFSLGVLVEASMC